MAPTNQQIADLMSQIIKSTDAHTAAFVEASTKQTDAFIQAVDRLIENDNTHHEAFRRRLEDISLAQVVTNADTKSNTKFRDWASKLIIGVILTPVLLAIVALVLK